MIFRAQQRLRWPFHLMLVRISPTVLNLEKQLREQAMYSAEVIERRIASSQGVSAQFALDVQSI